MPTNKGEEMVFSPLGTMEKHVVPDIITKLVEVGKTLFGYLTWGRLMMLFVLTSFVGVSLAFWENRPVIYSALQAGKFQDGSLKSIGVESQDTLKQFVNKDSNIIAMQVVSTDFKKFVRDTIFFYSDDRDMQREFEEYHEGKGSPTPVLSIGDEEQNSWLIAIINQEFVCVELPVSVLRSLPSAKRFAKQICSISVPPQYGKMVGYINVWMKEPLTKEDVPYYKTLARNVADEIYERDSKSRR